MTEEGTTRTAQAYAPLDELCRSAAMVLGCEVAVLLYGSAGVKRVIGSYGLAARYKSFQHDFAQSQYGPRDRVAVTDVRAGSEISAVAQRLGVHNCAFFLREPVAVDEVITVALLVFGVKVQQQPDKAVSKTLASIVKLLGKEIALRKSELADAFNDVTVTGTLSDLRREVDSAPVPQVLLDGQQTIIAISEPMCSLLGRERREILGLRHKDVGVPASEAIGWLYQRALETRLSPPEFEVVSEDAGEVRHVYRINVAPLSPTDTRDYFLFVSVQEVTELALQMRRLDARISKEAKKKGKSPTRQEPSLLFLLNTLVQRRKIHERNSTSYLSLLSWRQSIRAYQIEALKALKQNIPPELPLAIAEAMNHEIHSLIGAGAFRAVVPMPCGHSPAGACLSLEVARALGVALGLPVISALALSPQKGGSHPKTNAKRPAMTLIEQAPGPVILVDDVATSGAHIEEAVKLLKPGCGAVLAVVWISGDKL
jgi:PAS domain-containing protein